MSKEHAGTHKPRYKQPQSACYDTCKKPERTGTAYHEPFFTGENAAIHYISRRPYETHAVTHDLSL